MLKGISPLLSPQLLEVLTEMGHGDSIVIGDAYFAAKAMAKDQGNILVRADGLNAFDVVDAILELMPLDTWAPGSVTAMGWPDENGVVSATPVTEQFKDVVRKHNAEAADGMEYVDRFAFYDLAKQAYCVLATGDGKSNGCLILRKGVFPRKLPFTVSPQLLRVLGEMGHGDTITIGDAYFAAATMAERGRLIRADGVDACTLIDDILSLIPLDNWADHSVTFMGRPDENGVLCPCEMTERMSEVITKYDPDAAKTAVYADRFEFYDLAKKSFAVVSSGETDNYGCVILQKGVK